MNRNLSVSEAVARARQATEAPVILVDVGDNIDGGSPGDGTVILQELMQQDARGAVVALADPQVMAFAFSAGVGRYVQTRVGGKFDAMHGAPVYVLAKVRLLSDGRFIYRGSYRSGQEVSMGCSAVLEIGGPHGITLLVSELKVPPFDQQQLRSVGITPEHQNIIVVKAAVAWRAAYEALVHEVLEVETPGICANDLSGFTYRKDLGPSIHWMMVGRRQRMSEVSVDKDLASGREEGLRGVAPLSHEAPSALSLVKEASRWPHTS